MADVVDTLNRLGAIFANAAQTIQDLLKARVTLEGDLAAAKAELARCQAAPAPKQAPTKMPRPPRPRKAFGTATNVERQLLQHTVGELEAYGQRCYDAGVASTKQPPPGPAAEEDAWAEYRAGRGPHPTRK